MFDDIQPLRGLTPSFIAMHQKEKKFIQQYSKRVAEKFFDLFKSSRKGRSDTLPEDYVFFDDLVFHDFEKNLAKCEEYLKASIKELNTIPDGR